MNLKHFFVLAASILIFFLSLFFTDIRPAPDEPMDPAMRFDFKYNILASVVKFFACASLCILWWLTSIKKEVVGVGWGREHNSISWFLKIFVFLLIAGVTMLLLYEKSRLDGLEFKTPDYSFWHILVIAMHMVIIAPILEELIFRGLLQGHLEEGYHPIFAMILTAVFFAVMHDMQPTHILGAFTMSFLRYKTKVLWPAILLHICGNGGILLFEFFVE